MIPRPAAQRVGPHSTSQASWCWGHHRIDEHDHLGGAAGSSTPPPLSRPLPRTLPGPINKAIPTPAPTSASATKVSSMRRRGRDQLESFAAHDVTTHTPVAVAAHTHREGRFDQWKLLSWWWGRKVGYLLGLEPGRWPRCTRGSCGLLPCGTAQARAPSCAAGPAALGRRLRRRRPGGRSYGHRTCCASGGVG